MFCNKNALLAISLCAALVPGAASAVDINGGKPGGLDGTVGSLQPNQGHITCTAAINSDGTIATKSGRDNDSVVNVATTFLVSTGTYQVGFQGQCANVQIANSLFHVVQPDTLQTGTLPARSCYFRAGVTHALWIYCFNSSGVLTNTSFTVSVSR